MYIYEYSRNLQIGKKYDNKLSVAEITKLIRSDIKKAIENGNLPKDLKVSVTKSRGSRIEVTIKDGIDFQYLSNREIYNRINQQNERLPTIMLYSEKALALFETLEKIGEAYLFDNTDAMIDYFNANYYLWVSVDYEYAKKLEEKDLVDKS